MNISQLWPFSVFSKTTDPVTLPFDVKIASALISQGREGKPFYKTGDLQSQLNAYTLWAVYRCVNVIADSACSVPFRIYSVKTSANQVRNFTHKAVTKKKTEWLEAHSPAIRKAMGSADGQLVEIQEHPFHLLMKSVNNFMNEADLKKLKFVSDRLTGNAYWYKVKDKSGKPIELWPLAPQNMAVIPSSKNFIDGYEYRNGSTKVRFEEHEIIHFKDPSPFDPYYGISPLSAAVDPITILDYMFKFNRDLFANMAIPATVLSSDQMLTDDVVNKVKTRWKEMTGFLRGRNGDVVVMGSGLKAEKLTMTAQELSYNDSMLQTRDIIFGVFGVPLTKADPSQIAANNEASDEQFLRDTIKPLLIRDQEKLNEKLLPEWDERLIGAYDDPVPGNKEFTLKENVEYVKSGIKTRNEVRQSEGLEPLPEDVGDEVPPWPGANPFGGFNLAGDEAAKSIAAQVRKSIYGGR